MAAIDNAYSYYLTTYGNRISSRYDSHKRSDLRKVYNNIVKLNKESPLYKLKNEGEVAKFAIDIKENAQNIRNVVASISGSDDIMEALQKKSAVSSQEDIVKATYIGKNDPQEHTESFQIEVQQLAKPQINIGNFINSRQLGLTPDSYSFDLTTTSASYEFQFNVNPEDTNLTIQNRLANLITNAGIGLSASVLEDENGRSALRVQSDNTGLDDQEEYLFKISAGGSVNSSDALNLLGIDQISQEAQNSSFLLNSVPRSSYSNTFSINNVFELELVGISPEGDPATVGFKPNAQAMAENVQSLADAYNGIVSTAQRYSGSQPSSHKLLHQISSTAQHYQEQLSAIGLEQNDQGQLQLNAKVLTEVIESDNPTESLSVLNHFKQALDHRASLAELNPIEYVNKTVVAYKNPGRNFAAPYVSSIYSGLMLDRYC